MPDNKKTNAVNLKDMTPAQRKEQMATWKQERTKSQLKKKWANQQTKGNNKTNKNHRNTVKNKKRMVDKFGNPTKHNKATNPNLDLVKKTGNQVLAGKDPISQGFSLVAGGALVGGLSAAAKAKGLINVAKTIKTAGKIKKAKSLS